MASNPTKKSVRAEINTFVQGFVTEASPLNFPPNASVAEENFELNKDGSRDRRRGMDFEDGWGAIPSGLTLTNYNDYSKNSYVWHNVGGDSDKEFIVIQSANTISFFDSQVESISGQGLITQMQIPEFNGINQMSFTSVDGYLVIAAGVRQVAIVSCDANNAITYVLTALRVRDVWGIAVPKTGPDQDYDFHVDYRGTPDTSLEQIYNLQNQSWGIQRRGSAVKGDPSETGVVVTPGSPSGPTNGQYSVDDVIPVIQYTDRFNEDPASGEASTVVPKSFSTDIRLWDPLEFFRRVLGRYPSNSESVFNGLAYAPQSGTAPGNPSEQMMPNLYDDVRGSTQPASKGYFIIDALNRGASRVIESYNNKQNYPHIERYLTAARQDVTQGGATVVQEFAGRVFYAGFDGRVIDGDHKSPNLENCILFSQVVRNTLDIERCYQEGDPTSREGADIVDTDGGFIKISDAGTILALKVFGQTLLVLADNGVWIISGGGDYGFTASNYKVVRMSSIGCLSGKSVVEEINRMFYWGEDGIYMIGPDQFQTTVVKNITQQTIQAFYENLPSVSKASSFGEFDPFTKKIRWIFNEGAPFTSTSQPFELVLDSVLGAFTLNRISKRTIGDIEIFGMTLTSPFKTGVSNIDVLVNTDQVFVNTDLVTIGVATRVSGLQSIRYPTMLFNGAGNGFITFSTYNQTEFRDWKKWDGDGIDAKAWFITGNQTTGDSAVDKQVPYLVMHFRRTENGVDPDGTIRNKSGCLMRSQWDFSNSPASHKWSPMFQAYRYVLPGLILSNDYDSGFEVLTTKNKLRGRGKAFALYCESEPDKDLRLLGWNISVNGNAIA